MDSVRGTNVGDYPNFVGGESGDVLYLLALDGPTHLTLSTCNQVCVRVCSCEGWMSWSPPRARRGNQSHTASVRHDLWPRARPA